MVNTYLSREAAQRLKHGAPWVRREDIVSIEGTPALGEAVQLRDEQGRLLGLADVDLEASYAVRRLGYADETAEGLIPRHVRHAFERRALTVDDPRFCRAINDDGDALPGLIVDRYDRHLVVQTLTRAMDARLQEITRALVEVSGAESVLLRNDTPRRRQLGLPAQRPHVLHGTPPRWTRVLELGARFTVDLQYGSGVGYPYDQRELRRFLARLSQGARVLDPSCHVGGLFVHAGRHGARSILAFDSDADTADLARENGEANGLLGRLQVERGDALDVLHGVQDTFDLVLLDTPDATSAETFVEQVRLGLRATRHGGVVLIVGYHPPLPMGGFDNLVAEACEQEERRSFRIARFGLPPDHPTLVGFSATDYLSGIALEAS
ncbi:LSU m5C1962 methyltransferase RlmI [Cystobacter fuscus DSM 2262]|uniref:LSU m5C1962 methyltransferase RlmI n=1 Tax=Cystobacter fuscus (strain ATCC 25194 / DSM 2262 / NBRC 100088 / M29) TaxID=1242864 RepID=S9PFX3_CYSF2|nr:class I SAM-dependent methyltransferase [Cystobacter fuscus]EPX63285.1 LSU m5C1962 methyltransferase RlmI [Cystobacter fuscus DSM 2262]